MSFEIRRVPPDWEHPKWTASTVYGRRRIGDFMPLHDDDFESAADRWEEGFKLWVAGEHPGKNGSFKDDRFWEYGSPPERENHRERKWTESEATHYQVYETVSEGTPVTPHFATLAEIADYLVAHGTFWDQKPFAYMGQDGPVYGPPRGGWSRSAAEQFVSDGDAPSAIAVSTKDGMKIYEPRDGKPPGLNES